MAAASERQDVTRVVVVGDKGCGKTSFIRAFHHAHREAPATSHYGVEIYKCRFETKNQPRRAVLLEVTADAYISQAARTLFYLKSNIIVIMYAIDDPKSLQAVRRRWLPEILPIINLKAIPVVIVGNKKDRRDDPLTIELLASENLSPVTTEQGLALSNEVGGVSGSVECSSFAISEVERIFMNFFKLVTDFKSRRV